MAKLASNSCNDIRSLTYIKQNVFAAIYGLLWTLIYALVRAYESLRWLSLRLHAVKLWSYDHLCRSQLTHTKSEREILERCKTRLSKQPRHLNIIVGADDTQVDENLLSRLFTYALIMDFECVSVHDARSAANGRVQLQRLHTPKEILYKELQEHQFSWCLPSPKSKRETRNGQLSNGTSNAPEQNLKDKYIEIYELTEIDGRVLISDVCRSLYEHRHSDNVKRLLQDRKLLMQYIDEQMSQRLNKIPDPEVSIIFSRQICTYGLLPWQTRFTEFHLFETGRYFDAQAFANLLYKYSRCEQRWGK